MKHIDLFTYSVLGCCLYSPQILKAQNEKPNIILIVSDDMGYGDFGCYGNKDHKTPNIDWLAAHGMRFTDFHTNGAVSSPTRAALMTGRYQQYAGIEGVITAAHHRDCGLDPSTTTVAKLLRENHYDTAMYGKWHLGYDVRYNPIHQGFNDFVGYVSGNVDYFNHIDQEGYADWWHQDQLHPEEGYTTYLITDYAEKYLKKDHKKPFFLYLPYEACHGPWQGPDDVAFRTTREVGHTAVNNQKSKAEEKETYTAMVEALDRCVGRVLKTVKETGLDDNTIILFFSDNGGAHNSCNAPWSGWKGQLLEGGQRVSSIVYWPKKVKGGQVSDEIIMTMDVLPTLCDLTDTPMKGTFDGLSFLPTLLSDKQMPDRTVFWRNNRSVAARHGKWKLQINRKTRQGQLIDLSTDIKEVHNLWDKYPQIAAKMLAEIDAWEAQFSEVTQFS